MIRRALRRRGITVGTVSLAAMMEANLAQAAVVPASLTAALGKVAIAGARAPSTATVAKTIGGLVAVKKAGIGAVVVLGAVVVIVVAGARVVVDSTVVVVSNAAEVWVVLDASGPGLHATMFTIRNRAWQG